MAEQKIIETSSIGLFNGDKVTFGLLEDNAQTADFYANLSDCKDSIIAIIDIPPTVGGTFQLICKSADGNKDIIVPLVSEEPNVVRLTTLGIKGKDGNGHFTFVANSDAPISMILPKIAIIKCIDAVNN
ncbi:MAG: hypothetical protein IJC20_00630 [Clostridia bacterium]|nr:hypothetical protein [Clostridia bacterium]